ncbi:hypothetical protein C0J52_12988 [Blattella germanica]|nr:hypothetical protein C0J52_12988 [Blattella germanica]
MKMAGRSTTMQCIHVMVCLVFGSKLLVAAAEIQVVNLPSDADKIEEFLNNERQHNLEENTYEMNPMEPTTVMDEDAKEMEKFIEYLGVDIAERIKNMEDEVTDPKTEDTEDVWLVEMSSDAKIISQRFIDNEKQHSEKTNVELPTSHNNNEKLHVENTHNEVMPENSSSQSSDEADNNVEMKAIDLIESDPHPLSNVSRFFLDEERLRSEFDNKPLQSVQFVINEGNGVSSQKLDFCGTVNLNKIVDEVIGDVRKDIVEYGYDKIKIPNIHESFKKAVGILTITGDFKAQQGWAMQLSTIQRTADVIASSDGNTMTLACGFGLRHLEIGYDNYVVDFMHIKRSGKIAALIEKDSLLLNATVSWANHTCTTELNHLELNKFQGLKVKITGLGPLNFLVPKIADWAFQKFRLQIKHKIEATLIEIFQKQFQTFDCVEYIFKYLIH